MEKTILLLHKGNSLSTSISTHEGFEIKGIDIDKPSMLLLFNF